MSQQVKLTLATLEVLATFMSDPRRGFSGADIAKQTKLASGTLYPILARLEQAAWVESYWEMGDPSKLGRPRRRYYNLTKLGFEHVKRETQKLAKIWEPIWKPA